MARPRGRPTKRAAAEDIKIVKSVIALKNNPLLQDAYKEIHPKCSDATAKKNAKNMLTPEVVAAFKEAMGIENFASATRDTLERVFFTIVARWYAGEETTQNVIAALRELTKIVPGWENKLTIKEEASEEEVDAQIKELGYDPTKLDERRN